MSTSERGMLHPKKAGLTMSQHCNVEVGSLFSQKQNASSCILIPLALSTSCLQAFMYAGVALFKAGMLRTLLERSGHSCTAGNHLAQFIPKACSHPLGLFPPLRPVPTP